MSTIVQAPCPHCQQMLRIPAEWVGRPMRCKHCRKGLQARAKPAAEAKAAAPPAPVAVAAPPTPPMPAVAATPSSSVPEPITTEPLSDNPFALEPSAEEAPFALGETTSVTPRAKKSQGKSKKGLVLAACLLLTIGGLTAAGVVFGPTLFSGISTETETNQVGEGNGGNDEEKGPAKKKPSSNTSSSTQFPRRALLININNYLYTNPLHYGSPRQDPYPGSSTNALYDQLQRAPMNIPTLQIVELSDNGRKPHPPFKEVIEATLNEFVNTSRSQDRLVILFAGQAIDIGKDIYLVPLEGNLALPNTLIPLKWVYDKLARCKARQKVLILDICRFPPARGLELPVGGDEGKMTEAMDAFLEKPPKGLQVWSSCTRDQQSIELEKGSVFLQALCHALQERLPGIAAPADPLPVEALVPKVNQRMKDILDPQSMTQVSRLAGSAPAEGAAYDPKEVIPPVAEVKTVLASKKTKLANPTLVKAISDELALWPPSRLPQSGQSGGGGSLGFRYVPTFLALDMEGFEADDYSSLAELEKMIKDNPEKYPLRKAVLEANQAFKDSDGAKIRDNVANPGGDGKVADSITDEILEEQKVLKKTLERLKKAVASLKETGNAHLAKETSKRWKANYEFALARLQGRLVYLSECYTMMGNVRADNLPELMPIHSGWRVGMRKSVSTRDVEIRQMVKDITKTWLKMQEDYPGTPWGVIAQRESLLSLGMEWRATRD